MCSFLFYISAWIRLTVVFKSYLFSHVFWLDVKARDTGCLPFQKSDMYFHLHVGHRSYAVDFETDGGYLWNGWNNMASFGHAFVIDWKLGFSDKFIFSEEYKKCFIKQPTDCLQHIFSTTWNGSPTFVTKLILLPFVFTVLLCNFKYQHLWILKAYLVHNYMQPQLQNETVFSTFLAVSFFALYTCQFTSL